MNQVSGSSSSVLYSSKSLLMAVLHAIITIIVFVPLIYVVKLLTAAYLTYSSIALRQLIPVAEILLVAILGYAIYSKSQRSYLLSHPAQLLREVLQVIIYRFVIAIAMTLLYLVLQNNLIPDSLAYMVFFSFDPLVIFDLTFSQIFLSSNIILLLAPVVTTFVSTYFIILGFHVMQTTDSASNPAPIGQIVALAGGIVLYLIFLLLGSVEAVAVFNPTAKDAIISAYRFTALLNFAELIVLTVLLWYVYPVLLGIDASRSLLVNRKSQLQVVVLGMLGAVLPMVISFGIFIASAFSTSDIIQFLALDLVYLLYNGFLFCFEILVAITLKFGLLLELGSSQQAIPVEPTAVTE